MSQSTIIVDSALLDRIRIKNKNEIGEKEELISEYISKLRIIITEDPKFIDPPKQFDYFLLQCLRARKYNLDKAAKTYKKFLLVLRTYPEVRNALTPSRYTDLYKKNIASILSTRDSLGRAVLLIRAEKWDPNEHSLVSWLSAAFMMLDQSLQTIDTQLNGLVSIMDMRGLSIFQVRQVGYSQLRMVVSILQDSYPARFKEFHIINHPFIFNMMYNIAKPMLKDKLKKRIYFHGYNSANIIKHFGPAILPAYLGGNLNDDEYADQELLNQLSFKDGFYKDFHTLASLMSESESS